MNNKYIDRREAIKRLALAFAGTVIGSKSIIANATNPTHWETDNQLIDDEILVKTDDFFFKRLSSLLDHLLVNSPFDKTDYTNSYDGYTIISKHPGIKEKLNFTRKADSVSFDLFRQGSQKHHAFLQVVETVEDDDFTQPITWRYDNRLSEFEGSNPMYGRSIKGEATRYGNKIKFFENVGCHSIDIASSKCTLTWNVIDIIQRIDLSKLPISFETIDEYDMYGGRKTLEPYRNINLNIHGKEVEIHGYLLHGDCTLPTFLWLDDNQRLMSISKGMEVYILRQ